MGLCPSFPRGGTGADSNGMPLLSSAEAMLVFFSSTTDVLIPTYFLRMNASEGERMWSKRASELADIARISEAKWRAHSTGCREAWDDFASLSV